MKYVLPVLCFVLAAMATVRADEYCRVLHAMFAAARDGMPVRNGRECEAPQLLYDILQFLTLEKRGEYDTTLASCQFGADRWWETRCAVKDEIAADMLAKSVADM